MESHVPKSKNEKHTAFVVLFSAVTMVLEIVFGFFTHSMALLADGIHMGSHVLAIGLSWCAYIFVRRMKTRNIDTVDSERVLSLSAYTSGVLLLIFALLILVEAFERFFTAGVVIQYEEAMVVAVIGMVVNIICAIVLHDHHDYNGRSAYLHVLADALTSLGAIFGLVCAMVWNIVWIDTAVALICSLVILRWARKLLQDTGKQLISKRER